MESPPSHVTSVHAGMGMPANRPIPQMVLSAWPMQMGCT
jgi:hypothetical protein